MRFAAAVVCVTSCGAGTVADEPAPTPTVDTVPSPPSTVWSGPMNLPPPLTRPAARITPAIQISEPPPAPTTTIPVPPHYDIWLRLAQCESGGDWQINTGNGFYGGLQFTLGTWQTAGGLDYAARPDWASALGQMWTAERVLTLRAGWRMDPWGAWPGCARKLGLR